MMRGLSGTLILLVCHGLLRGAPLHAQQATPPAGSSPARETHVAFPGSFWTSAGYFSPIEIGNALTVTHLEQGLTLWTHGRQSIVPFAAADVSFDEEGFDWNNKAVVQLGLKYVRSFRLGTVQVGAGYAHERRLRSGHQAGQPIAFASYWFGWNPPVSGSGERSTWLSLPGSSWAAIGNSAPAEGTNIIGTIYAQQGVTLARIAGVSVIPFAEHTLNVDSERQPWNNRQILGEGIKMTKAIKAGVLEITALYKHERRWQGGQGASGLSGFVNFWYGWNPSTVRAKEDK